MGLGIDTECVDPVSEFIENARETYPGVRYRIGEAESLGVDDDSLGGILPTGCRPRRSSGSTGCRRCAKVTGSFRLLTGSVYLRRVWSGMTKPRGA